MESSAQLKTRAAPCPDCGAEVRLVGRLMIGEVFGCGKCSAQLEVAGTDPVTLEPLAKIDDDELEVELQA